MKHLQITAFSYDVIVHFVFLSCSYRSRDSSVIIVNRLCIGQPRDRRLILDTGNTLLPSPKRPDRLWGTPNILFHWYRTIYPPAYSDRDVKINAHHLVPRSRIRGAIPPLPIRLHGAQKALTFYRVLIFVSIHRPTYSLVDPF